MKYTDEEYARSYTEILEIVKYIPDDFLRKIPRSTIERYYKDSDKNYNFSYDVKKTLESQKVSHLTQILLANLYIDYWASEEERNKINSYDKKSLAEKEQEKRKVYNPNEVFNQQNVRNNKIKDEESMIPVKSKGFFEKIIDKIKIFIKRKV